MRTRRRLPRRLHGGAEPDLPGELPWRQAGDFRQHATIAAVTYIRAAADRARAAMRHACQEHAGPASRQPT